MPYAFRMTDDFCGLIFMAGQSSVAVMAFRKHIGRFLVLVMLTAQLALAQHATVHFLEDRTIAAQADTGSGPDKPADHDKTGKDKVCQICVSAKGLSHSVLSGGASIPAPQTMEGFIAPDAHDAHVSFIAHSYQARAPPVLLS